MLKGILKCIVYTGVILMMINLAEGEPQEDVFTEDLIYNGYINEQQVTDIQNDDPMTYVMAQHVERCGVFVYDTLIKAIANSNLF
ncbi:hypothetical protein SAMN05421734_103234 [Pelagirhabdus alkalitolerans]|uniref:Uncharacterized protein n=1 Tax=Pelagirhabdus alkalitolerans TaxID=1612202 RepID=A0A1G6HUR9_9BACI|nr:hypothetical protein [Pelagirhabdus alkalitolerans]SDB97893.1 hypothetical protein SAMN05421734_103234 [Pelagirhabdus alkalitolerans]